MKMFYLKKIILDYKNSALSQVQVTRVVLSQTCQVNSKGHPYNRTNAKISKVIPKPTQKTALWKLTVQKSCYQNIPAITSSIA